MDASPYIYEPSKYPGHEKASGEITSGLLQGKLPIDTLAGMFKSAWEQSLLEPRTRFPIVMLEAIQAFSSAVLEGLISDGAGTLTCKNLMESGAAVALDDRLSFYDSFLGLAGDSRKWVDLGEKSGPIEYAGEVLIDQSTADAIYTYVGAPLVYGKFPSPEAWDDVSRGREVSNLGIPDSVASCDMLNRCGLGFEKTRNVLSYGLDQFQKQIAPFSASQPAGQNLGSKKILSTIDSLSVAIGELDAPKASSGGRKWVPFAVIGAVGAGIYAYSRMADRDNA
jgi:hypothetical protein